MPLVSDAIASGLAPVLAGLLVLGVFALFATERRPAHEIAFLGAVVALALGLVSAQDVLVSVANPAPLTIAAMYVLSAALVRTGVLEALIDGLSALSHRSPPLALAAFFGTATVGSAFLNNTPVVMVLIPVAIGLAGQVGTVASRLLIPLSYVVILGGTVSMIGTSTNLLVDGVAQGLGLPAFGLFEIAPLGLLSVLGGGVFLALAAPFLLPDRSSVAGHLAPSGKRAWLADLFIPAGSPLIGEAPLSIAALRRGEGRVIDVLRNDVSLRRDLAQVRLAAGDTVVVKTRDIEIVGFAEGAIRGAAIPGAEPARLRRARPAECLVTPGSKPVGRRLGGLRWRRRFGVYPLALHRKGAALTARLEETPLQIGDTLLIDGAPGDIERMVADQRLILLAPSPARAFRRDKAPMAIGILAGVVMLSAFGVAGILPLALIGTALVVATGCIDAEEALAAVDARLLILIVSMLVLGSAVDNSGAAAALVGALGGVLGQASPWLALALVYLLTSVLTELVSNAAVAVLMTPIAAGLAASLGVDARPFVVAVMFAASASFATPVGYQTNTLVYGAGGYRFADFLRIGVPMNLIVAAISLAAIPVLWPF